MQYLVPQQDTATQRGSEEEIVPQNPRFTLRWLSVDVVFQCDVTSLLKWILAQVHSGTMVIDIKLFD